jgi:hypothetical protein
VTEPTSPDDRPADPTDRPDGPPHDRTGDERPDESRDISDVGLPHPGDDTGVRPDAEADEAALDEVFPAADR